MTFLRAFVLILATAPSQGWTAELQRYASPDKSYEATVVTLKTGESKIHIAKPHGKLFFEKSFESDDGEHGDTIIQAAWSPNSRFFVFMTQHSGGHSPLMHPIYFWDRRDNQLRMLDYVVGGITGGFTIETPDIVRGKRIASPDSTSADDQDDFSISLTSATKAYRRPAAR